MTGRRSVTHPSSVSALRADPPSPTRGEGKSAPLLTVASLSHIAPTRHREPPATDISGRARNQMDVQKCKAASCRAARVVAAAIFVFSTRNSATGRG
ncbi:MAG: hypothetical protein E5Y02_32430 [Mesorhizobium sp.]|nr:MAG: hypothetical protein E5Y02_32430 [Mesorhizobium sp.]